MENKQVVLIRKQDTEFKANYPYSTGNIPKEYVWLGTKGKMLNEKAIPFEVFEWLRTNTTTFQDGCLIIKETEDEIVRDIKENISEIEKIEEAILTKPEIESLLTTGNHLTLKKKLDELINDKPESAIRSIKRQVTSVAQDLGVDSSAKRKVLCDWAEINYENNDLFFDKEFNEMLDKESN